MSPEDPALKDARTAIRRFMRKLRGKWVDVNTAPPEAGFFFVPYRHAGEQLSLPLGWVGSRGCSWARQGGCTMCDYGGFSQTASPDSIRDQILGLMETWGHPSIVNLSSLGSVFDPRELDLGQRRSFFETLGGIPYLKYVGVESRCEYVTEEVLKQALEWLRHVELDIGVGLESHNELIRNVILNKALTLRTYDRAVLTMNRHGVLPVTHVFLKPPLLTEREAVEDAAATIRYAVAAGSQRIVLMLANIKERTLPWWLTQRGLYRVPWLWSALRLLLSLTEEELSGLFVYGFKCGIPLLDTARNCASCTKRIELLLDDFNRSGERAPLRQAWNLECSCRFEWEHEFARAPTAPLRDRAIELARTLSGGSYASC